MDHTYTVRCPDCGSSALRSHLTSTLGVTNGHSNSQTIKTECPSCDYLLITCPASGNVIDTHSSTASVIARTRSTKDSDSLVCIRKKPRMPWFAKIPA